MKKLIPEMISEFIPLFLTGDIEGDISTDKKAPLILRNYFLNRTTGKTTDTRSHRGRHEWFNRTESAIYHFSHKIPFEVLDIGTEHNYYPLPGIDDMTNQNLVTRAKEIDNTWYEEDLKIA